MRSAALLVITIFIVQSCAPLSKDAKPGPALFFIKDHAQQFKHQHITTFPRCGIKDLTGDEPGYTLHKPITGDLAYQVFQDGKYVSDSLNEWTRFLYAVQNTSGHQAIVIGGMDDDWVNRLYYRSYDRDGKFVAELILYECGGDGGYTTETFGKFINDSVYRRTSVNCELSDEVAGDVQCDSLLNLFIIHTTGKIEEVKN